MASIDKIIVLDFGGQYAHLIARRVQDLDVACEVLLPNIKLKGLKNITGLKGIILSGGAASVYDKKSPKCDKGILTLDVPVLGICYGHQLMALLAGGKVEKGQVGEYGICELTVFKKNTLFHSCHCRLGHRSSRGESRMDPRIKSEDDSFKSDNDNIKRPWVCSVWMNHRDIVKRLPRGYQVIAATEKSPIAVFENEPKRIYGVQFHPEVSHTTQGRQILKNFVFDICQAKKGWQTTNVIKKIIQEAKDTLGGKKVVIGLSGGVDSSTTAILVQQAIGKNLTAVYVDTGLMREQETEFIRRTFSNYDLNLKIIRAGRRFFKALKGVASPEKKRKVIGKLFVDIFSQVAKREKAEFLIQGTIYSDRIESGLTKYSSRIKSHHNVAGLPKRIGLKVYEPLRDLYKDEVRKIALRIGLPKEIISRQVFPGPGLAIRIIGEITPTKVDIVRRASWIIEQELRKAKLFDRVWMAFAVLLPIKSVGIQGDSRTYKYPIVVRIIESQDAMTANFAKIPYKILETISTRITNEVKQVNRVVYDISNKPPATMEWE